MTRRKVELVDWPAEKLAEELVRRRVGSSPFGRSLVVAVVVCKGGALCLFLTWLSPSNECFPGIDEVFIGSTGCGVVLSPRDASEGVYEGPPEEAVSCDVCKTAGSPGFIVLRIRGFVLRGPADFCTDWKNDDAELAATEVVLAGP